MSTSIFHIQITAEPTAKQSPRAARPSSGHLLGTGPISPLLGGSPWAGQEGAETAQSSGIAAGGAAVLTYRQSCTNAPQVLQTETRKRAVDRHSGQQVQPTHLHGSSQKRCTSGLLLPDARPPALILQKSTSIHMHDLVYSCLISGTISMQRPERSARSKGRLCSSSLFFHVDMSLFSSSHFFLHMT